MNTNREQTHLVSEDFYYVSKCQWIHLVRDQVKEVLLYQQLDFTTFHYDRAISLGQKW